MSKVCAYLADNRGVSALEFALIAPVLFALIGGTIEYGRTIFVQQQIRDIIDEAVRAGVVTGATTTAVRENVTASLDAMTGLQSYAVTVNDGTTLSVTVDGTLSYAFGGVLPAASLTFAMTSQFPR